MEGNNRKRKGFMKGKLVMSFYRATKPSSTLLPHHQHNGKVVKPTTVYSSTSSVGYIVNHDKVTPQQKQTKVSSSNSNSTTAVAASTSVGFIVDQGKVNPPQPKQRVSFIIPDNGRDYSHYGKFDNNNNPYGIAGDEGVDVKAASYISCVQERFRLERVNSECKKSQDNMIMQ